MLVIWCSMQCQLQAVYTTYGTKEGCLFTRILFAVMFHFASCVTFHVWGLCCHEPSNVPPMLVKQLVQLYRMQVICSCSGLCLRHGSGIGQGTWTLTNNLVLFSFAHVLFGGVLAGLSESSSVSSLLQAAFGALIWSCRPGKPRYDFVSSSSSQQRHHPPSSPFFFSKPRCHGCLNFPFLFTCPNAWTQSPSAAVSPNGFS